MTELRDLRDWEDIGTLTVPSLLGPLLIVTFEQSRSPKGVAQTTTEVRRLDALEDPTAERYLLGATLKELRDGTVEAHGVDLMPHQDDWYWFDPWPPEQGAIHYHTVLKYGDGVTNLREHALQTLKHARARGVKIKVPIRG